MKAKLRTHVAALMLLAPVAATLVAQPAVAQQRTVRPVITSMAVNSDQGLSPGATLRFQLAATSNARVANVKLGDSGIVVPLRQQTAGNYAGSYVIRRVDRIDPTQPITTRVTHGKSTIARDFSWPPAFQALAMGAGPSIERFVMRPMGRIEPGSELRFRLRGMPGADASMDIPGVISGIDLAEVRPGVYEGTYTVRRRDNPDAFRRAVATLRNGNQRATARVDVRGDDREWGQQQARDERPPQITELTPANGDRLSERGRVHIGAKLSDEGGSGIDPASVRLRLAGRDVTADARVTGDEVQYRRDLEPGRYSAEVTVRDGAGNTTTKAWTFDVVDRDRAQGPAGPLELRVTSHTTGGTFDGGNVMLQGRTAPNATVRVQVDSVANLAGRVGVSQPVLDQTIQADGDGRFNVSIAPAGLPIPGARYDVHLTANRGSQTVEERLTLHRRG